MLIDCFKKVKKLGNEGRARLKSSLDKLYPYAYSLTRNEEDAQDLIQETALKALSAKSTPDNPIAYRVWLFKILRNACIDKSRLKIPVGVEPEDLEELQMLDFWCENEQQLDRLNLKLCFERLSISQREIISLIDIVGASYAEAAEILNVPNGTIMSRLSRARRALISELNSEHIIPIPIQVPPSCNGKD